MFSNEHFYRVRLTTAEAGSTSGYKHSQIVQCNEQVSILITIPTGAPPLVQHHSRRFEIRCITSSPTLLATTTATSTITVPPTYHASATWTSLPIPTASIPFNSVESSTDVDAVTFMSHTSCPSHPIAPSRTLSHSQHSNIYHSHSPHRSTPIFNPKASSLQLQTPTVASHHWTPTPNSSTPNTSQLRPEIFSISPHSPFCSPAVASSSSGGPHIATYHHPAFQLSTPAEPVTPSRPPLPPPQYHQPVLLSCHTHPSMLQFGLFTPFPSPHPVVPPDKNHNNWNFSVR